MVRRCSTTSTRKRRIRNGRFSREKLLGAAAISWTRRPTCAANAPTNPRNSSQKTGTATGQLQNGRIAELQEAKELSTSLSTILPSCHPAMSTFFDSIDDRRHDLEEVPDDAVVGDLED